MKKAAFIFGVVLVSWFFPANASAGICDIFEYKSEGSIYLKEKLVLGAKAICVTNDSYTLPQQVICPFMEFNLDGSVTLKDQYVDEFKGQCSPFSVKIEEKEEVSWFIRALADMQKYHAFMH